MENGRQPALILGETAGCCDWIHSESDHLKRETLALHNAHVE